MATRNKRAAKAARREAKAERKSANAVVSNFSSLKNLNMGQTIKGGAATKNPKDIRVGISFLMTFVKSRSTVDYSTDLDRFTMTYNYVRSHPSGLIAFRRKMYETLMYLIKSDAPIDEYFFTVGMHYLVTFDSVSITLKNHPYTGFGYMIEPLASDPNNAMLITVDYDSWETRALERNAA